MVKEGPHLSLRRQAFDRFPLEHPGVVVNLLEDSRREDEKSSVDPAALAFGFLLKSIHIDSVQPQRPEARRWLNGGERYLLAVGAMKGNAGGDVDIAHPVAVGHAESLFTSQVVCHLLEPAGGPRMIAGVHQRHIPRLGHALMHFHPVVAEVEGHIRHVQEVVGEILLDHVPLVAAANDEVVNAVLGIDLQDVPQDGKSADIDHRLGTQGSFFAETCAQAPRQNHCFHASSSQIVWRRRGQVNARDEAVRSSSLPAAYPVFASTLCILKQGYCHDG